MKRITSVLLAILMVFTLTACGEKMVDITLPSDFVEAMGIETEEDLLGESEYIDKASINEDGSATLSMTEENHKAFLADLEEEVNEQFTALIEDEEELSYIIDIKPSEDFKEVVVVISDEMEGDMDSNPLLMLTPLLIGATTEAYQMMTGEEDVSVSILLENESGEEIGSIIYPDYYEELAGDLEDESVEEIEEDIEEIEDTEDVDEIEKTDDKK